MSAPSKLVNCTEARAVLGVGKTFLAAVRREMGLTGRKFSLARVSRWMEDHPNFKISDV